MNELFTNLSTVFENNIYIFVIIMVAAFNFLLCAMLLILFVKLHNMANRNYEALSKKIDNLKQDLEHNPSIPVAKPTVSPSINSNVKSPPSNQPKKQVGGIPYGTAYPRASNRVKPTSHIHSDAAK
ncbi:MAG: hypothetical protein FWE13_05170 [Firmicutes bacterium]|nr:hypothetical protein [Bacillota bacterium]